LETKKGGGEAEKCKIKEREKSTKKTKSFEPNLLLSTVIFHKGNVRTGCLGGGHGRTHSGKASQEEVIPRSFFSSLSGRIGRGGGGRIKEGKAGLRIGKVKNVEEE